MKSDNRNLGMFQLIYLALLALAAQVTVAVQPLVVQGANIVNQATGSSFQIVGVAYQPGGSSGYTPGSDPLSDGAVCLRDAALMQRLGVNAIRVYNVDPNVNHDLCASIFNAAGIYMLVDVNSPLPNQALNAFEPWTSYNTVYLNRTFGVVEAFKNYPNTLLFFAGNEVINDLHSGKVAPPYIRAVVRDIKNYIAKHCQRSIPVGYSAADFRDTLYDQWNYLQCSTTGDTKDMSRVDIFALNSYSWCGDATFQSSGFVGLTQNFSSTSVPVFFSEYGCNNVRPRIFSEVQAIYGPQMTPVLSGGNVYEYTQAENDYGLVVINKNGSVQLLPDFDALRNQYLKLNFTTLEGTKATKTSVIPPACAPSLISKQFGFNSNFTLPVPPPGAQDLIDNGIPNPNNGKIISVTNYQVSQTVQASNGAIMSGLAVKPLPTDQSNAPVNDTTTTMTTTTTTNSNPSATSSSPSTTSSNAAAGTVEVTVVRSLVAGILATIFCL